MLFWESDSDDVLRQKRIICVGYTFKYIGECLVKNPIILSQFTRSIYKQKRKRNDNNNNNNNSGRWSNKTDKNAKDCYTWTTWGKLSFF